MVNKITPPFVRSPYNYDVEAATRECEHKEFAPTLTQQSQALETDINEIARRFGLTGQLPDNVRQPQYADFEEVFDFHSAQNAIAMAQTSFNRMPPDVRARFNNDPQEFLAFVEDDYNLEEAKKLGLVKAKAAEGPNGPSPAPSTGAGPNAAPVVPNSP